MMKQLAVADEGQPPRVHIPLSLRIMMALSEASGNAGWRDFMNDQDWKVDR